MTPVGVAAGVGLALAFAIATAVALESGRRTRLGPAHPAVVWVAFHGVLFGIGSFALAVAAGRGGPAVLLGGALIAFTAGAVVARPRGADTVRAGSGPELAVRPFAVALLVVVGVLLVLPTLVESGIPFLVGDITGSRVELSGLVVQPLRVFLPAAAIFTALRARREGGSARTLAAVVVGAVGLFELLLASRYLVAELGAGIVIGWLFDGGRIGRRLAAGLAAAAVVVFGGIQLLRAYDQAEGREVSFVVERTLNRVLLIQPRTIDALMATIPAEQSHFGGATWLRRLAPIVGVDPPPNLGYWIYPRVVGQGAPGTTAGVAGYAAPGLLGEAWANLGGFGLVLFVGLGAFAERLGRWIAAHRRSIVDVVAGALATLFLARTHALGLNGLAVVLALVAAWRVAVAPAIDLPRAAVAFVERSRSWR